MFCPLIASHIFWHLGRKNSPNIQWLGSPHLLEYFKDTWIIDWTPNSWNVYGFAVRTNNHLEGWHNGLNKRVRPQTPFYLLIQALHQEVNDIPADEELLELHLFRRRQKKLYTNCKRDCSNIGINSTLEQKIAKNYFTHVLI